MDGAAGVQRVVEVQRVTHAGVQQCGLWRRQAGPTQQHTAFLPPAPVADHRTQLVYPRGTAAAEHAAEGIENIASSGLNGACGQVRIAGAADMLGERPGGIIGHWLSPTSWHRLPGGDDCGQQADQAGRLSLPISR